MQRRELLAGLGALAAGGAAAVGTGAFTRTTAARSVSVNVADEDEAYLALDELDGTTYQNATFASQKTANLIALDFNDEFGTDDGSDGVGLDSVYEFDNVFQIENQGTQSVDVEITSLSGGDFSPAASGLTVEFYPGSQAGSPLDGNPVTLTTGESRQIGLKIETVDPDINDFSAEATVSANST
jgi:hypothetical protein